jgi:hypothetical protein
MQSLDAPASSLSLFQTSSDIWFGDRNLALLCTGIADCWQIFSPSNYYKVGTSGNIAKCHIISAGLWLDYLQTSLFISMYQTAFGIISPVGFAKEASHFQYKLRENHNLTVQPVITYIYLCGQIYASFILLFKPSFWNWAETELKCNKGIRENIPLAFYHIQTVGA